MRYSLVQAVNDILTPDCLPPSVRGVPALAGTAVGDAIGATSALNPRNSPVLNDVKSLVRRLLDEHEPDIYRRVLSDVERVMLGEVLSHAEGNQVQASELLGISRTTLRHKLEQQTPDETESGH